MNIKTELSLWFIAAVVVSVAVFIFAEQVAEWVR